MVFGCSTQALHVGSMPVTWPTAIYILSIIYLDISVWRIIDTFSWINKMQNFLFDWFIFSGWIWFISPEAKSICVVKICTSFNCSNKIQPIEFPIYLLDKYRIMFNVPSTFFFFPIHPQKCQHCFWDRFFRWRFNTERIIMMNGVICYSRQQKFIDYFSSLFFPRIGFSHSLSSISQPTTSCQLWSRVIVHKLRFLMSPLRPWWN